MEDGTITRNVFGVSRKEAETISFRANKGDYSITTLSEAKLIGKESGKKFGEYEAKEEPTPPKKITEVVKIKMITDLDDGSANNKSGAVKKGMVFGKKYKLEAIKFKDDVEPEDYSTINWKYRFIQEDGTIFMGTINKKGKTVEFELKEVEGCGRDITFCAYIVHSDNVASLEVFSHYRFRWFDRAVLINEVNRRKNEPYLADQKSTPLCGMAAIFYVLAKKNFDLYKTSVLDLHRTGIVKINSYAIDVKDSKHLLEMNPLKNTKYPYNSSGKMPYCDWITFSCARNQENAIRDYDGEDDFELDGATLPNEIEKLMKEVLNFKTIKDETNLIFTKSASNGVAKMQELFSEGSEVFILINTGMISGKESGVLSTLEHWVVFEGETANPVDPTLHNFKIFTWGGTRRLGITSAVFNSNYYGYVAGK